MGRPNRHPNQFRRDALELVKASERPIAEVARTLRIAKRCGTGSERPVMPTLVRRIQMGSRSPNATSCAGFARRTSSRRPTRKSALLLFVWVMRRCFGRGGWGGVRRVRASRGR